MSEAIEKLINSARIVTTDFYDRPLPGEYHYVELRKKDYDEILAELEKPCQKSEGEFVKEVRYNLGFVEKGEYPTNHIAWLHKACDIIDNQTEQIKRLQAENESLKKQLERSPDGENT